MDTRTLGRNRLAVFSIVVVLGLVGCDSVYTIHSIHEPSGAPSSVPDVSGLWAPDDIDSKNMVLRIAAEDYDSGNCRNADIRLLGTTNDDDVAFGDQICFVAIAGQLVAQLRSTGDVQLYQQYLFKFNERSIAFCSGISADLLQWAEDHPTKSAVHGIEFARREWQSGTQLFVTSSSDSLRTYLEARLPQLAKACDEDDDGPRWDTYTRMTPPRQPDAPGAAEDLPSRQD